MAQLALSESLCVSTRNPLVTHYFPLFFHILPYEKTIPGYPPAAARKEIARLLGHLPMIREVHP
jgi:hypothetical protein